VFVSAFLLVVGGIGLCLAAARVTLSLLGLGTMQTLLWLGLAEIPPRPLSRRLRPGV